MPSDGLPIGSGFGCGFAVGPGASTRGVVFPSIIRGEYDGWTIAPYDWRCTFRDVEPSERRIRRTIRRLPEGVRRDLLTVLDSTPEVRADLIRQFYERPDTEELAEVLIDLEAEPILRLGMIEALRDSTKR